MQLLTGVLCRVVFSFFKSFSRPTTILKIGFPIPHRLMFCTSAGQSLDGKIQQPSIQRAFMNGSHPQSILTGKLVAPRSIAVDPILKQLYWYDSSLEQIGKVDYDGSRSQILARGVFVSTSVTVKLYYSGFTFGVVIVVTRLSDVDLCFTSNDIWTP